MDAGNEGGGEKALNHVGCEGGAVPFDSSVIRLKLAPGNGFELTLIGSRSAMMDWGTGHWVRLTSRRKEAKF
jgi:hypothetical protein